MNSFFKKSICHLIFSILLLGNTSYIVNAAPSMGIEENSANKNSLPRRFRAFSKDLKLNNTTLNLKGLENLNISGSSQFSQLELEELKKNIDDDFDITVIDLREESHGFINGIAFSVDKTNLGFNTKQIIKSEKQLFKSIPLNKPLTFSNNKNTVIPKTVTSEYKITKNTDIDYKRIPVTDGHTPNEETVKYFIDFVNSLDDDSWLHFHCKEGIGRTTTFMIMYDLMKNGKEVGLNDIVKRQVELSQMPEKTKENFFNGTHHKFLVDFYNQYINTEMKKAS